MSFLEPRVKFSSNFASLFNAMRHNSSVLFHLDLYMLWTKETHQKANVQTFDCSHKIYQIPCYFSGHMSVFASPFSFMTKNSSEIFQLKHMLWTKRAHHCTIFQTLECSNESSPNFSCHFETTRPDFVRILHHCSVLWKITPLYFFSSNLIFLHKNSPSKWHFWTFEWLG